MRGLSSSSSYVVLISLQNDTWPPWYSSFACVCVCEREVEIEKERKDRFNYIMLIKWNEAVEVNVNIMDDAELLRMAIHINKLLFLFLSYENFTIDDGHGKLATKVEFVNYFI